MPCCKICSAKRGPKLNLRPPHLLEFQLPMPDGSLARFKITESPVMAAGVGGKISRHQGLFPDGALMIRRRRCGSIIRLRSFHAQVLSPKGAVYVTLTGRTTRIFTRVISSAITRELPDGFPMASDTAKSRRRVEHSQPDGHPVWRQQSADLPARLRGDGGVCRFPKRAGRAECRGGNGGHRDCHQSR